jgi:hypothetical protein
LIERKGDWLSARVGDEIMMMSPEHGKYIGVNEVGARIWELIETPSDVATVCEELQREFEVSPEICKAEVDSFLAEMEKHGAIVFNPA